MAYIPALRIAFGVLLIWHGLSHAVFPLRGAGPPLYPDTDWMPVVLYATAMIGFVVAGLGILGVRPMDRAISQTMAVASVYSVVAMIRLGHGDLWFGAALDLVLLPLAVWRGYTGWFPRTSTGHARQILGTVVGALVVGYVTLSATTLPEHRSWGTTIDERRMRLPGDSETRDARFEIQHGVTIEASPADVWPWLLQLGQDRGGFYSYDWLERLFGADVHNARDIRPEWQQRRVGDSVRATQPAYLGGLLGSDLGWTITALEPNQVMVLENWGAFVLVPTPEGHTRLIVRSSLTTETIPVWAAALQFTAFELPHFIMERRMLLNIKSLAERRDVDDHVTTR